MYYRKNLAALTEPRYKHALLIEKLESTQPTDAVELCSTDADDYTLVYKNIPLHSAEGAIKEAKAIVEKQCNPGEKQLHLILGIGLGYVLNETFQASLGTIIVYEPDLPLLRFVLENVDLAEYLSSGQVRIASNIEELTEILKPLSIKPEKVDVLTTTGYACLLAGEIPELMEHVLKVVRGKFFDMNTFNFYHLLWVEQLFKNLHHFPKMHQTNALADKAHGKTALLISSGPSLDGAIEAVRAMQDSAVLLAVGGALKRLCQEGITPDIAIFYDTIGMREQLAGLPTSYTEKITFLLWPVTQAETFEQPVGSQVLFLSNNIKQLSDWVDDVLDEAPPRLEGGTSVSIIALQAAYLMGCETIVLVGQDLAFSETGEVYAGGVKPDSNGHVPETVVFVLPGMLGTVPGQNGQELTTLKSYMTILNHLEDVGRENAELPNPKKLINASIGGARIEGFAVQPLSEFRRENDLPAWKPENWLMETLGSIPEQQAEERHERFYQGLLNLSTSLEESIGVLKQLRHQAEKLTLRLSKTSKTLKLLKAEKEVKALITQLRDVLRDKPFVGHCVIMEALNYRDGVVQAQTPEDVFNNIQHALHFLRTSQQILQDRVSPVVKETLARFEAACEPAEAMALS